MGAYITKAVMMFRWKNNMNKTFNKSRIFNSYESVKSIFIFIILLDNLINTMH